MLGTILTMYLVTGAGLAAAFAKDEWRKMTTKPHISEATNIVKTLTADLDRIKADAIRGGLTREHLDTMKGIPEKLREVGEKQAKAASPQWVLTSSAALAVATILFGWPLLIVVWVFLPVMDKSWRKRR